MKKNTLLLMLSLSLLASCGGKFKNQSPEADNMVACDMAPPPPPAMETVKFSAPAVTDEEDKSGEAGAANYSVSTNANSLTTAQPLATPVKIAEKIKKTANIDISVDDYKVARAAIEKIVKSGSCYIAGEDEQNSTYSISNTIIIRVTNKDFDGMVGSLSGVASHVNSKNISLEDVTAEFVDITARLKTKKEVEQRYLDLLQKAVKVSDILEVEAQLRVIREEIEAKEGELKYLNDQVDYSTINLSMHQNFEYTPADEPGFFGRMGHAFGNGWNGLLSFLIGIVYTWPVWIISGLVIYVLVRFIKRRLKKK